MQKTKEYINTMFMVDGSNVGDTDLPTHSFKDNSFELTDENRTACEALAKSLNIKDLSTISDFGLDVQKRMGKQSTELLVNTRTYQCEEMGELIMEMKLQLDCIDIEDFKESNYSSFKRFLSKVPVVGKGVMTVEKAKAKYTSLKSNIEGITHKIEATRLKALRDNTMLEKVYDFNVENKKEFETKIIAANLFLERTKDELEAKLKDGIDEHEYQDTKFAIEFVEHRIVDMMMSRNVAMQQMEQIRFIQRNNFLLANNGQSLVNNTMPMLETQVAMTVILSSQKKGVQAQKMATDLNNTVFVKNSELVKDNTISVTKEINRNILDIESLSKGLSNLFETMDKTAELNAEASKARAMSIEKLKEFDAKLQAKLLEYQGDANSYL